MNGIEKDGTKPKYKVALSRATAITEESLNLLSEF